VRILSIVNHDEMELYDHSHMHAAPGYLLSNWRSRNVPWCTVATKLSDL